MVPRIDWWLFKIQQWFTMQMGTENANQCEEPNIPLGHSHAICQNFLVDNFYLAPGGPFFECKPILPYVSLPIIISVHPMTLILLRETLHGCI